MKSFLKSWPAFTSRPRNRITTIIVQIKIVAIIKINRPFRRHAPLDRQCRPQKATLVRLAMPKITTHRRRRQQILILILLLILTQILTMF